jgi:uncharacterized protein YjbI with pentapeptide repeats
MVDPDMIVTQSSQPAYPQPMSVPAGVPTEPVVADASEQTAATGTRGIALLAGDTAAILIAQQNEPTPAPAPLDLSGRDLRAEDLSKLDLRGANLSGVDLTGKDLTGLDLTGAKLTDARLDGTTLIDTKLNEVDAKGASFTGALFVRTGMNNADFSGAKFNDAYFGGTKDDPNITADEAEVRGKQFFVDSSKFTDADFSGVTAQYALIFVNSNLDDANFEGAKAPRQPNGPGGERPSNGSAIAFNQSSAKNVSFDGTSADITTYQSDLSGANFSNSTSNRLHFTISKLDNASFKDSDTRLQFVGVDLKTVDLAVKNKDHSRTAFVNADISGQDFSGYDFSGTYFQATGSQADTIFAPGKSMSLDNLVTGTNFSGANFKGATFEDFDMRKALTDAGALDEAKTYINWTDSRYAYLGDIFKNVKGGEDAAQRLYAMPVKDRPA